MFKIVDEIEIEIEDIPIPWISKIELYYPDLPQFPIIYINTYLDDKSIIACPVSVNYKINDSLCNATFTVLINIKNSDDVFEKIKEELSERIGTSQKISKQEVIDCCNDQSKYISLLSNLWEYLEISYGETIPYGKFYEEIYSIVRFVAAWQPKTGRQSEMRMLYNFMSAFGEVLEMPQKWRHLEFYAIPNLHDIKSKQLNDYPKFSILNSAMNKLFDKYFTRTITIDKTEFKVMERAWKQNKDDFIKNVTLPMCNNNQLSDDEKLYAEILVDAFNRHAWRAAYFISAYLNIDKGYENWSKEFFINFYNHGTKLKGYSEKVIACFLQQGFLNKDAIPIDTWINTFYEFPLGIANNEQFFNDFSNLGKLERVIWLASQSNKTNMKVFFNILWCQRYGTIGNGNLRGINPIACYSCELKKKCVGACNTKTALVLLVKSVSSESLKETFNSNDRILYVCLFEDYVPKKCYKRMNNEFVLIDEFSGYILTQEHRLSQELFDEKIISFEKFIFAQT